MPLLPLARALASETSGLTCLVVVVFCLIRWLNRPADRVRTEWLLVAVMLSIPLEAITRWITIALATARSTRYDLYIDRIDALAGSPAFALGRIVAAHPLFQDVLSFTYDNLPLMLVAVFATHLWLASLDEAQFVLVAFATNLAAAVPIYLLIPVSGPAFAFPSFPAAHLAAAPHAIHLAAVPNGIPSVHTSTALLVLWFLWRWPLGRLVGVAYLGLTICGTLGSGQHYVFDLLCALPYTMAVLRISRRIHFAVPFSRTAELEDALVNA